MDSTLSQRIDLTIAEFIRHRNYGAILSRWIEQIQRHGLPAQFQLRGMPFDLARKVLKLHSGIPNVLVLRVNEDEIRVDYEDDNESEDGEVIQVGNGKTSIVIPKRQAAVVRWTASPTTIHGTSVSTQASD